MKTIAVLKTFTGYPDGTDKSKTVYSEGATVEVADDYAALLVAKGLVREGADAPVAQPSAATIPTVDTTENRA